jgi:hypothetical protein
MVKISITGEKVLDESSMKISESMQGKITKNSPHLASDSAPAEQSPQRMKIKDDAEPSLGNDQKSTNLTEHHANRPSIKRTGCRPSQNYRRVL